MASILIGGAKIAAGLFLLVATCELIGIACIKLEKL